MGACDIWERMPDPNSSVKLGPVAIVDDDPAVLDSLRFLLGLQGFEILAYSSGSEFFATLAAKPPSCIIVDQNMPDLTGLDIASRLRSSGSTVPIIMLTGFVTEDLKSRARALGIKDVIGKSPSSEEEVARAIHNCLLQP